LRIAAFELRIEGLGFKKYNSEIRVKKLGFRV
jgi:hypothetical protein